MNSEKQQENRTNIYKTKAITPALQKLYKCLDEDLTKIICDIENSTKGELVASVQSNDLKILSQYLYSNAALFTQKWVNHSFFPAF